MAQTPCGIFREVIGEHHYQEPRDIFFDRSFIVIFFLFILFHYFFLVWKTYFLDDYLCPEQVCCKPMVIIIDVMVDTMQSQGRPI